MGEKDKIVVSSHRSSRSLVFQSTMNAGIINNGKNNTKKDPSVQHTNSKRVVAEGFKTI